MPSLGLAPLAPPTSMPRLSDLVFERIAESIVRGELAPGEPLRDQPLADSLGVSRMPVREAIQRLERAGMVETAASRYTRVSTISETRIADALEHAGYLYGSVFRMATLRMSTAERAQALTLLGALEEVADERDAAFAAGRALNEHMLACCRNSSYRLRSDMLYTVSWLTRHLSFDDTAHSLRRILPHLRTAVADGDADGAERLVRDLYGIDAECLPA